MRWFALASWLLTVGGGTILLASWLRHGGLRQTEGVRATRLLPHVALASLGLVLWIAYLVSDRPWLAWVAASVLLAVAGIGLAMLSVTWRGRTQVDHTHVPADASFPPPVVLAHGVLGATTLVLAFLAAAGVG